MCKICGTTLSGAWVDVRIDGVHRRLCESCGEKEMPAMGATGRGL